MPTKKTKDVAKIFAEGTAIDWALRKAVREALLRHKKLGQSVVVWRDGKVVRVPPEEIPVGPRRRASTACRGKKASLSARWKYWGVGFAVSPCSGPVGLEGLLVDTAKELDRDARFLVMTVTWLVEHHAIVGVDRLAALADKLHGRDSARLGLLLETAQDLIGTDVFQPVLAACRPWAPPEPLFALARNRAALARLAEKSASRISRNWGLWTGPLDRLKPESLRPASWIAQHNPTFVLRALLKGDVRSKVIAALAEQELAEVSETALTRLAGCTRRAMHLALDNLESAGLILRKRQGRSYAISLCQARFTP